MIALVSDALETAPGLLPLVFPRRFGASLMGVNHAL